MINVEVLRVFPHASVKELSLRHHFLISIFYVSYFLNRNELENESKNFSVDVNANEARHGPSSRVPSIFAPFFTHRSPASAKYV